MEKQVLGLKELIGLSMFLSGRIKNPESPPRIYGVPRGGVPVTYLLAAIDNYILTDKPEKADIIVDDIIASGKTRDSYMMEFPGKRFEALIDQTDPNSTYANKWVIFPWEVTEKGSIEDNVLRLLQFLDPAPYREGLNETPGRVAKAWKHWAGGYETDISELFKHFEDGAENYDQMIVVRDIPFYSHCEHHLAPFFGTATIGYIPNGRIIGLSKFSRIVDAFARRLQVQERMTNQIAESIMEYLKPCGVGVYVKARHLCMESRGIRQQGSETITTAIRGSFQQHDVKMEFLEYVQ